MKNKIIKIAKDLGKDKITESEAKSLLLELFNSTNSCNQVFGRTRQTDDFEFSLHQHWKNEDDRTGFDSKSIGVFSDW